MKFVLVGDGFPAVETLKLLTEWPAAEVVSVFSSQPRAAAASAGRNAAGIPRYPSELLRGPAGLEHLASTRFDWLININSTVMLPPEILARPVCGALNMHPGLLPAYAGLHAHQWAIRNGERDCGATIHFIEPRLDTGDIVLERRFAILPEHTGLTLFLECIRQGTAAMREVLRMIMTGVPLPRTAQDASRRRLYRHRDALDGRVDWTWPADVVERFVRAGNYAPLASPSYTAHVAAPEGAHDATRVIELLRVRVSPVTSEPRAPGELLRVDAPLATLVACGDGRAVALLETRFRETSRTLAPAELCHLLPRGAILGGRA